jgi:microcystin-dependent protein
VAIQWGAWEYSGGNGMRVGLDVSWEAITHGETAATATIKIYTENQYTYGDSQTLNYGGSLSGSTSFTNNDGGSQVLRATKTYTYNYSSSSYGSSPGDRTFTATISGAYNGVTPSKSVTSAIPARPYGAPAAPTSVVVSRVSDTSSKVTWVNHDTSGEPWDTVRIQVDAGANDVWNGDAGTTGGGGTSFTDSTVNANSAWRYRVRAENSIGDSAWVESGLIYTTPAIPSNVAASSSGLVSWTNTASSYMSFLTEIQVTRDGGATWGTLYTAAQSATSYQDPSYSVAQKTAYRLRHKTNGGVQGTLYSDYSAQTAMSVGVTSPPNAPTNLAPTANQIIIPAQAKTFTWAYNSTDTTPQSAYQIQYRVVGSGTWTTLAKTASSAASWSAAGNTFTDNSSYEWQVRTWGTASTGGSDGTGASAWSTSGTFKTVGDPNNARVNKRVMRLDLDTGEMETAPMMVLPPIGSMLMYGGAAAPQGWLLCQGQSLLRSDYPDLFAVIGTTYGSVDATHFTLPNLTGRMPMGAGVGIDGVTRGMGWTGGQMVLTVGNIPTHSHSMTHTHTINHDHSNATFTYEASGDAASGTSWRVKDIDFQTPGAGTNYTATVNIPSYSGTSGGSSSGNTGDTGSSAAFLPPVQAVNFIIKT